MTVTLMILKGFGVLVGFLVIYMLIVMFAPGFSVPYQLSENKVSRSSGVDSPKISWRKDVRFDVDGSTLAGWLYLPDDMSVEVPCIIMATGLGGTKDFILEPYAFRFRDAGYAVLTFDYRFFGKSGGEPRQMISVPHQLEDLKVAIQFTRSLKEVDSARIGLWGTSMGGGHVITTAARDSQIACVTAMVPMLDGSAEAPDEEHSAWLGFRMFVHGQRDMARSRFGLPPHRIPIVGRPGSIGLMTSADAYDDFTTLLPDNFDNQACAGIILRAALYKPVDTAQDIQCPVLLQISEKDSLIPVSASQETIRKLGAKVEVQTYAVGHFEIYTGKNFERSVGEQIRFFSENL